MMKCDLCQKTGSDLPLLLARHKELGSIYVCQDCWTKLYAENRVVTGGTGCGPCASSGPCSSCGK